MVIAHASERLSLDDPAFVHAVGIAARSGAAVRGIHIERGSAAKAVPPAATSLLERWKRPATAVDHAWVFAPAMEDTAEALLEVIVPLKPELLVLNTRARSGLARWFVGSVAEGVARNVLVPTLLLPLDEPAFVDAQTGTLTLDRVLVPAGPRDDTERAIEGLGVLLKLAGAPPCSVELLHVDDGTPAPQATLPADLEVTFHRSLGPFERVVADSARKYKPNLIVMTSHGHDELSDIVLSSHTERVLHEVRRPLLWVPARRNGG